MDSTNNYAANLLKSSVVAHGTVVMAQFQTAGKGQRGNEWLSEPGQNLLMSLILKPQLFAAADQFLLNKVICLGIVAYLKDQQQISARIKWPNDILIDERKLAGVLIENAVRGQWIESSICGIGMNLNQLDFPKKLFATSVRELTWKEVSPEDVVKNLLPFIAAEYQFLRQPALINERYLQNLFGFGEKLWYQLVDSKKFVAEISGIGPHGELLLLDDSGRQRSFGFKEVKLLGKNGG